MKVEKIELPKELTEKTACEFIGRLASVCTGKEPVSDAIAEKIGRMNLTEHLGKPTRCWEFLPVLLTGGRYHNFREGINGGLKVENLCKQYNVEHNTKVFGVCDYYLFKISVPKYVRDHVKTHVKLSHISSSARIGVNKEKLYEFPEIEKTVIPKIKNSEYYNYEDEKDFLTTNCGAIFYCDYTAREVSDVLNTFYNRKEITKRSLSDFEVVDMVIGGYFTEGWDNFIKVRTASCDGTFVCSNPGCEKPCIQKETRELALIIKDLIGSEK